MHADRLAGSVHDKAEPLVKRYERPIAVGNSVKGEVSILIALGKLEGLSVRIAQADVTSGMRQRSVIHRIARGADVTVPQGIVRRTRHVQIGDLASDRVSASSGNRVDADICIQARVDNRGIGSPEKYVVSARAKFLEVGRFTCPDERIQEVSAVQRVGLQPFLVPSLSLGSRMRGDSESAGHQVPDNRLAGNG